MASVSEPPTLPFDNQSFDYQVPAPTTSSRKRPLPAPQSHFNKAHKASLEAGLEPVQVHPGCRVLASEEFDKIKSRVNKFSKSNCSYHGHMSTQGIHKKLYYQPASHERVSVRKTLETRINVNNFEYTMRNQYFDLRCYNYAEIIMACFPAIEYRKRWIVLEEDRNGQRFIHHRQLTEETKAGVKMTLSRCESANGVKNKLVKNRTIPALRHLAIYDILISVYGTDFYTKHNVIKQCGPIPDLPERMTERYRCIEKAQISPITSMITPRDCKLTLEQKHVIIGLLHQETNINKLLDNLARIFPESFSARSCIDVLDATFGRYKDICIVTKSNETDNYTDKSVTKSNGKSADQYRINNSNYKSDKIILDDQYSCVSVFKAIEEQRKQESGGKKKGSNSKFGKKWSKGQVMNVGNRYSKGSVI